MRIILARGITIALIGILGMAQGCGRSSDPNGHQSNVTAAEVPKTAPRSAPTPVVVKDAAQLVGVWEATTMADSGHPARPVPPGTFFVLGPDSKITLGCASSAPTGSWSLDPTRTTIKVTLGNGSVHLQWVVIELSATTLTFVEGGDIFTLKRRQTCT